MSDLIRLRRGTTAEWNSANPILRSGEPGVDLDTGELKIGDGSTAWNSLTSVNPSTLILENRTSDPVSPVTGQIWIRTDL